MFEIYAYTHAGKVCEHNEDAFLVNQTISQAGYQYLAEVAEPVLVAVADGMGGYHAGEIASRLALDACCTMQHLPQPLTEVKIRSHIQQINQLISMYGKEHPDASGLGTTLTGFFATEQKVTTFHIGDSRLYRFRGGCIRQLTKDHSLVQSLLESGKIQREEMPNHPQRNVVLRCLGGPQPHPTFSLLATPAFNVDIHTYSIATTSGDIYLLCSDGLSALVTDDAIEDIFNKNRSIEGTAYGLIKAAMDRGGQDNITVVLVRVV